MFKKILFFVAIFLGIGYIQQIYGAEQHGYIKPYQHLLSKHVKIGSKNGIITSLVDYQGWKSDQSFHQQALASIQKINPQTLSKIEQKVFWINAYNLLTIDLIIKTNEKDSIKNQGSVFKNVWKTHKWEVGGKQITLDEIEHKILRPLNDPRIHMAINCASLSCPDLRAEPYLVNKVESQLEDQTRGFINNQSKGVDFRDNQIFISEIFKWFKSDFGDQDGVIKFISKYTNILIENQNINYLTYNWKLNTN